MLLAMKREHDDSADVPPEPEGSSQQEFVDIVQVQRLLRRDRPFAPYNAHGLHHPHQANFEDWFNVWFNSSGDKTTDNRLIITIFVPFSKHFPCSTGQVIRQLIVD